MVEVCIFTKRVVLLQLIIKFRPKHYFQKKIPFQDHYQLSIFISKTMYHDKINKVDYTKKLDNLVKSLKITLVFLAFTYTQNNQIPAEFYVSVTFSKLVKL